MKEYGKNQSKNVSKKVKENNELKSAKVGVITKSIKDEVESSADDDNVDVYDDDNDEQDKNQ